jgi:WD40 repeat protein
MVHQPIYAGLVRAVSFRPDGRAIAVACQHTPVYLWDAVTGIESRRFVGDGDGEFSLAFSSDGKFLASGGSNGDTRIWEVDTGKKTVQFHAHGRFVSSVAFTPDGKKLVTSGDIAIRAWDPASSGAITTHAGHFAAVHQCSVLPDQRTLVTGSGDGTIRF